MNFSLAALRRDSYPQRMLTGKDVAMVIRAVLFDFDGTLTEPGSLDFGAIRESIGCPPGRPVLEFIRGLPSQAERDRALQTLDGFENDAARNSRPNAGAEDAVQFTRSRGLKVGIISRNSLQAIDLALRNFGAVRPSDFSIILSRDDPFRPKPSPEGILAAARKMGVEVSQVLVVGDFVFDIEAGHEAGAITAFLTNQNPAHTSPAVSDFTLGGLPELKEIVELHAPLPAGKLPNRLLGRFLAEIGARSPELLLAPGVGEDAAAVPLAGEEVLVLKSDPITFTGRDAAFHAVTVNVNDVASCGASPRWLLATLLFPVGITPGEILRVMKDLQEAARANGLILCGGHTEVTDAVTRLVASAQVAGTVSRCGLIDKRNMRPGHRIVLTKRLAVEGTGIIAAEFPSVLKEIGMSEEAVGECRRLMRKPGTSIRKEAEIAACASGVSAMHDVTEGGLATALEELSLAGAHRIRIDASRIPVYDETRSICRLLGLDPLGLIGSGSLVIVCRPDSLERLLGDLRRSGIEATCLGEVLGEGCGVEAVDGKGNRLPWPRFETDEIARLFSGLRGEPPNGLSGGTGSPE